MSTSAISQSQTTATSMSLPTLQDIKNNLSDPQKWLYLIPTIGAIAIGILSTSHFALGLAVGGAIVLTMIPISKSLERLGFLREDRGNEYSKLVRNFPLSGTLIAPVVEEGIFRGVIQPLIARSIIWLVPTATAAFFGAGFAVATAVSIVATATLFGFVHLFNQHKNSHIQATITGIEGIAFGVLAAQFGLGASIAAHITVNTIVITIGKIFYKEPETAASSGAQSLQLIRG